MGIRKHLPFILLLLLLPATGFSEESDDRPAGHSVHGESFNEGPRQFAVLLDGMPDIDFPITSTNEQAQAFFNQGVGQLHGFWYWEAERSFRQVLHLDPHVIMAYWGMAMANAKNDPRAAKLMQKAIDAKSAAENNAKEPDDKKDPTIGPAPTRREVLYIDGLHNYLKDLKKDKKARRGQLVKDWEAILHEFPDDINAKAFLVNQLWDNTKHKIPYNSRQAVDALIDQVLAEDPLHPIHHMRIHLWDYAKDKRALQSAVRCGTTGPGIAHLWHMPGHIFYSLHRFADMAWSQEAAARIDHAHLARTRTLPDHIHNYTHNNVWLVDTLTTLGRINEATDLARNLIELPRLVTTDKDDDSDKKADDKKDAEPVYKWKRGSYQSGQRKLVETLVKAERWHAILAANEANYFDTEDDLDAEGLRHHAIALAHANLAHTNKADSAISDLEAHRDAVRLARYDAADKAESKAKTDKKKPDEITTLMAEALKKEGKKLTKVDEQLAELRFLQSVRRSPADTQLAQAAKDLRGVPAHRHIRYHHLGGNTNDVARIANDLGNEKHQTLFLAHGVHWQWTLDKKDAARESMKRLRTVGGLADPSLPVFQYLAPVLKDLGLPKDWRTPAKPADDFKDRPTLDDLGPFRWSPVAAPSWTLHDRNNNHVSLDDYAGKPVLLVFYLGAGCAHCIEQLTALSPRAKEFEAAGIPIVAISTEARKGLQKTFDLLPESETPPFTILADPTLAQFKAYHAFDDFEEMPLHGTFLLDADGRVRWQDISFEPFMAIDLLLEESERLLNLPIDRRSLTSLEL